ncbi:YraN family protein [Noviherbaspirillum sp. UKPF54]|uniref:YraN family protein n=1 Tax=Noviherbaspirillum sp. UKPF54 TaxID=2601898 RepID=UPI0011B15F79|nr:YraN family protein [Noviherbaspirillum sp. UKPF54]QDZ29197.1 YraN family protein [Noviherbaspirillum sp. UKPF54]
MGLFGTGTRTAKQVEGQAAEDAALAYLQQQGLKLLQRNFRCKGGEIDLILQQQDTLVFVEVRKRADARFGGAAASITASKQARLILAAQVFLQRYRVPPSCRFDVVAFEGTHLSWIKNAIEA